MFYVGVVVVYRLVVVAYGKIHLWSFACAGCIVHIVLQQEVVVALEVFVGRNVESHYIVTLITIEYMVSLLFPYIYCVAGARQGLGVLLSNKILYHIVLFLKAFYYALIHIHV